MTPRRCATLLAGLLSLTALPAAAMEVRVLSEGRPVANAVVTLSPVGRAAATTPMEAVMDQVNSEFEPRVLVVTKGSRVHFPNRDRIRHQVYSFSPAKRFELPLYTGTPPEPVLFENTGVVTLGCNIHDWMKGYIVVVDTPHFALSDEAGRAQLEAPPGEYLLTAWHERLPTIDAAPKRRVTLPSASAEVLEIPLAPPPPPRGDERLRALQERLRATPRP